MSTSAAPRSAPRSVPPYTTPSPVSSPVPDLEPDEAWIANKRIQIEAGFQSMIQDAKDRLERTLQALPFDRGDPEWDAKTKGFFKACQDEKDAIRQLAKEELENEIATERLMRGMTIAGLSVDATVKNSVMQEQEAILAMIERERRNSTAGSVSQANVSPGSSGTAAASQQIPQQAPHSQSSHSHSSQQREAPRPTTVPAATSTSSTNAPVWEPPSARSSPEIFKPPVRPYHPEPPPMELRTSPGLPGPHSIPQTSANEGHFGSLGRTTASAAAQERRTTGSGAAPAPNGAPTDNRRMSTAPTGPPPSEGSFGSVGRPTAKERRMSGAGAPSGAPTDNRRMSMAPSAPNSSHRTPTAPLVSPVSARHEPSRQPTAPPVAERPGPPPFNPYSSPARPSASLHRQTSQTWKEATSTPISTESYRPVPSSLRTKPSQSSFHSTSSSNSGVRAEATWAPELTDEPEEEESFERAVPIPSSARSRDPASISENPIATSPPAAREFWTPTITPEEDAQASRFGRDRGGSGLRSSPSLKRKPMPSPFVEVSAPSTAPLDVRKYAEREAAERQETERSWKNLEQSREKEKSVGRVGGARLSTASEQVHRQNEHIAAVIQNLSPVPMLLHLPGPSTLRKPSQPRDRTALRRIFHKDPSPTECRRVIYRMSPLRLLKTPRKKKTRTKAARILRPPQSRCRIPLLPRYQPSRLAAAVVLLPIPIPRPSLPPSLSLHGSASRKTTLTRSCPRVPASIRGGGPLSEEQVASPSRSGAPARFHLGTKLLRPSVNRNDSAWKGSVARNGSESNGFRKLNGKRRK
ncbi:hypothetical protein DFH08DRAFT_283863 [Mycena albidolilacea]|uniref:Uncharacterized protein n=1 Tax=Mycena albidolilacea TaxID=1033008 RepID=A0AAD6ZRK4_9AGAR|nr:hypothetical protein DFH08DRAFT_283863 [Mycena albidolilacea]